MTAPLAAPSPDFEQCVGGGFLGQRRVSQDTVGQLEKPRLVGADQFLESRFISLLARPQQSIVVRIHGP
jgi:hypothetical protein